jgi:hypothetical protein
MGQEDIRLDIAGACEPRRKAVALIFLFVCVSAHRSYDNASSVLPPGGNPGASVDENSALQFTQAGEDLFLVADRVVHFDDLLQQPLPKYVTFLAQAA